MSVTRSKVFWSMFDPQCSKVLHVQRSDLDERPCSIQTVQSEPQDAHRNKPCERVIPADGILPKPPDQRVRDEAEPPRINALHHIGDNGIHSEHYERKCPFAVASHVNSPVEDRESKVCTRRLRALYSEYNSAPTTVADGHTSSPPAALGLLRVTGLRHGSYG